MLQAQVVAPLPLPLSSYPDLPGASLGVVLRARVDADPFNAIATAIFLLAVIHTFFAARFVAASHTLQHRHDAQAVAAGRTPQPNVAAELLHFFGEVEVVFGLWACRSRWPLSGRAAGAPLHAISTSRSTTPSRSSSSSSWRWRRRGRSIELAEAALRRLATLGGGTPAAWWVDHPDRRPAARLVHHRAGGDDDLRPAARPPVLRPRARRSV